MKLPNRQLPAAQRFGCRGKSTGRKSARAQECKSARAQEWHLAVLRYALCVVRYALSCHLVQRFIVLWLGMKFPALIEISADAAEIYLLRDRDRHLMHLGALNYDSVKAIMAVPGEDGPMALALLVEEAGALPDPRATLMIAADSPECVSALIAWRGRPQRCVIAAADDLVVVRIEQLVRTRRSQIRGLAYYGAETLETGVPIDLTRALVSSAASNSAAIDIRRLSERDARDLDLTPCNLSSTALNGWLRLSWRIYGAIEQHRLVGHALAAYPIDDSDEVAAVYTSGRVRRRGVGSAVVAAVIGDIRTRNRRAFYVASRTNTASCQLAEHLGLRSLGETWDVVLG